MAKRDKNNQNQEKESVSSEIIKKFKQNPGIYIGSVVILILVTVTFIGGDFISGGGLSGGGADFVFGYYEKTPINLVSGNFFANNYNYLAELYRQSGIDVNNFYYAPMIWRQAYNGAVMHTAVLQIMKRSNYTVSDNIVDREVARLPRFQENGRFSRDLYRQMPESTRLSIWRELQEDLIKRMYASDYSSILMSSGEAGFIAGLSSPLRNFEIISFNIMEYPEEEYKSYAQANANQFRSIHLSIITVSSSENEVKKVYESVKNGISTFEDAARNFSQDQFSHLGGDMSGKFFIELSSEIPNISDRDGIFSLRRGELSGIIRTDFGWSFFRAENDAVQADLEDEAIMERVRSYVRSFQRGRMEDWTIEKANNFITDARESGFEAAGEAWNLERGSFGPLPLNFGSIELFPSLESYSISGLSAQSTGSLARNENFWRLAFTTPIGSPSSPLVQGDNVFVFIPVEEINAGEESIEDTLAAFKSSWFNNNIDMLRQQYFLHSDKFDDKFEDAYIRYLM